MSNETMHIRRNRKKIFKNYKILQIFFTLSEKKLNRIDIDQQEVRCFFHYPPKLLICDCVSMALGYSLPKHNLALYLLFNTTSNKGLLTFRFEDRLEVELPFLSKLGPLICQPWIRLGHRFKSNHVNRVYWLS